MAVKYTCKVCGDRLDGFDAAAKHVGDHNISEMVWRTDQ